MRNSSAALIAVGHSHTTDSGVRMITTTSSDDLEPEAAEPGPRSASSGSPLYSTAEPSTQDQVWSHGPMYRRRPLMRAGAPAPVIQSPDGS